MEDDDGSKYITYDLMTLIYFLFDQKNQYLDLIEISIQPFFDQLSLT